MAFSVTPSLPRVLVPGLNCSARLNTEQIPARPCRQVSRNGVFLTKTGRRHSMLLAAPVGSKTQTKSGRIVHDIALLKDGRRRRSRRLRSVTRGGPGTVKIAYIDPLSGGGASIGEVGLKTFQYLADSTNAHGGVIGRKLEIVAYDNKLNAQESLVQLQKAIDSGIRFVTQGNGSAFAAAIEDFVSEIQ